MEFVIGMWEHLEKWENNIFHFFFFSTLSTGELGFEIKVLGKTI